MEGDRPEPADRSAPALSAERIVRSSGWDRLFSGAGLLLVLLFGLFALRGWLPGRAEALAPPRPESILLMAPLALGETAAEQQWADALAEALAGRLAVRGRVIPRPAPTDATTYIPHLAQQAGAQAALTTTLFAVPGGMRIEVRLIPADAGIRRWRHRYERATSGAVEKQIEDLAEQIEQALYGPAEP